ncbi:hypothetical protein GOP47_0028908 [Adiantum capillus-veneris]|nr:hypothetical protein GOP47_0028908 [Adiantum capillus-veneris]
MQLLTRSSNIVPEMSLMVSATCPSFSTTRCLLQRQPPFLRSGIAVLTAKSPKRQAPSFAIPEDNAAVESPSDRSSPLPPPPPQQDKKIQAREAAQKGQTTAAVTGAIAVILGVAYLVLGQLLDSRGVNLVPPPPEAFEP